MWEQTWTHISLTGGLQKQSDELSDQEGLHFLRLQIAVYNPIKCDYRSYTSRLQIAPVDPLYCILIYCHWTQYHPTFSCTVSCREDLQINI